MKKTYIAPASTAFRVQPSAVLAASPGASESLPQAGDVTDPDFGDYGEQFGEGKEWESEW